MGLVERQNMSNSLRFHMISHEKRPDIIIAQHIVIKHLAI